jgi:L-amino acid N-acyltransferase YncA
MDAGADLIIRDSTSDDVPSIAAIYAHAVLHGTGTFETVPPEVSEMARRRDAVLAARWPYLVATAPASGVVLGYAYAATFRPREAYRYCLEDSVYVAPGHGRRGVGRALLEALLSRCEAAGFRQMVAVIGDSANAGSIGLHAACGFQRTGLLPDAGWKFGRWVDVVFMTRPLGQGASAPPPSEAAAAAVKEEADGEEGSLTKDDLAAATTVTR